MSESTLPAPGDGKLYPLSFQQQTTLLAEQFIPGSVLNPAYILYLVLRLKGPLHYEPLQAAFEDVVERQAALRSRLVLGPEGEVVQEELSGVRAPVEVEEVAGGEAGLAALLERLTSTRIPTGAVPLARASVHRLGADDHALFLGVNHLAGDASGLYLVAEDLERAYAARLEGSRLPKLPLSYGEYSKWQAETYASRLEQDASFWGEYVAGLQPYEMRQDFPFERGAVGGDSAGIRLALLGPRELQQLERFATRHRATPLVMLLAGFHAALGHRTASEDRLSLTYFEQRDHPGTREMVGYFVAPAPIRIPFARDVPLANAFPAMVRNVVGAYRRAYMPAPYFLAAFPAAAPALMGEAAPWCFVLQYQSRSGSRSYRFGEARGSILSAGVTAPHEEPGMSLRLRRSEDGELWLRLGYDPKQWRAESMDALADRYGRALRAMMEDPSRTPAQILELIEPW